MADETRVVEVGFRFDVENEAAFTNLVKGLQKLASLNLSGIGGTGIQTERVTRQLNDGSRAISTYSRAINNSTTALRQQEAAEKQVQAALLRSELAYRRANDALSRYLANQNKSRNNQSFINALASPQIREAGESLQQAGFAITGTVTAGFVGLAVAAARSAIEIDKNVNALRPLVGGAREAEERFRQLFNLAQQTPGLTSKTAVALDAQLRLANVSEQTINRFLGSVGRLNAIQSIGDPQDFANNLRQLIDQGFERADLKQVVNRNPIAGELIREVFGVDNPTNSEAIRDSAQKLGIKSAEQFFDALAKAGENNPKLKNATESIAVQLEKAQDRLSVALRPLGVTLLNAIIPALESAIPIVEALASSFDKLPTPLKALLIVLAGTAAAIGPLLTAFGGLTQVFQVVTIGKVVRDFIALRTELAATQAIATTAVASQAALATATAATGTAATSTAAGFGVLRAAVTFLTGPWGIAIAAATALGVAYLSLSGNTNELKDATAAQVQQAFLQSQRFSSQADEIQKLAGKVNLTTDEQQKLRQAYQALEPAARGRIELIKDETERTNALAVEIRKLSTEQRDRSGLVGANIVGNLTKSIDELKELQTQAKNARAALANPLPAEAFKFDEQGLLSQQQSLQVAQKLALAYEQQVQEAEAKTRGFIGELNELGRSTKLSETELIQLADKYGLLSGSSKDAAEKIAQIRQELGLLPNSSDKAASSIDALANSLDSLRTGDASGVRAVIESELSKIAGSAKSSGDAVKQLQGKLKDDSGFKTQFEALKRYNEARKKLDEQLNPRSGGTGRTRAVFFEREQNRAAEAAQARQLAIVRRGAEVELAVNEVNFKNQLIGFTAYARKREALQNTLIDRERINQELAAKNLSNDLERLNKLITANPKQTSLLRERDSLLAEIQRNQTALEENTAARAASAAEAQNTINDGLKQEEDRLKKIAIAYLEITNQQRSAAGLRNRSNVRDDLTRLTAEIGDVESGIRGAETAGNVKAADLLRLRLQGLETARQQTLEILKQLDLNADFEESQRLLAQIEQERANALERLNIRLAETGATEDDATKQRRDLMQEYGIKIQDVINQLLKLQALGAKNPEIQRLIDSLKITGLDTFTIPIEERIAPIRTEIDRLFSERDRLIAENERSGESAVTQETNRLKIIDEFNGKLRTQLELYKEIEATRAGGPSETFKQTKASIDSATQSTYNFSKSLKDTAASAGLNAITQFFTDVATGAKSFKEAAIDALASFLRTIATIIIQILTLKLIETVTGIPVGALLKISAGGLASGGAVAALAEGGSVLGGRPRGFASGGSFQKDPRGFVSGPGDGKSDSVLAWFSGAKKFARVSNTEFVVDAETTRNVGLPFLYSLINTKGRIMKFASGGDIAGSLGNLGNLAELTGTQNEISINQTVAIDPVDALERALKTRRGVRLVTQVIAENPTRVRTALT